MIGRKVYVSVNLDLGWDNVIGVFDTYEKAFNSCCPSEEDLNGEDGDWYRSRIEENGMYELHHIHTKEVQ